ncbi:AzlC family ABC transporter permease [Mycolicibacterium diernhoferi]|uniref:Branched-chain amino acid ABC transporter permease n=1 Tax=Mycolicibacterium diernhoferi TaxID=1801 RepID=A0A1Q4HCC3_9MYCO|nr:AzlC family ABC transporter permease [Mycolicibacterium diernhoferi]OJZ65183.1 branched-chain amino acid ABC transporter permease [Mycolicibacterium diernhoferi]OPE44997.1 branched-chain amino acid ABC transporter permease [Mycolicibacterium diernhoferi]PEG55116.1 branched-chain amino acid ABC transporter permease [Mycolicibacterium diernhoferi]QYL23602.1 AzlC family ABC transporter permease [Mycolicibacterium diernhoferi]
MSVLRLAAPVGLAFLPLGAALGLLVVHAGLAWWWAPVFAAVIYAGSLEFLMVGLAAAGAPIATAALTALIVNSRHIFYALSFPLYRVRGVPGKLYSTYVLSDEAYAVAVSPVAENWTGRQILTVQAALHLTWTLSAAAGGLLGVALPLERLHGLEFALTALFIVLAIDAYRQHPDRLTAVAAVLCAVLAWLLVPGQMLVWAFAGFTVLLLARFLTRPGRADA